MRRIVLVSAFVLASASAFAQPVQQPDPAFLQKAIGVLQDQRNAALDGQAGAQTRVQQLLEENAALKKQVEDLQKKSAGPAENQTPSQSPAQK